MKYFYIFSLLFFFGCYSAKKAEKAVNKANDNYPEVVAKLCATKFPLDTLVNFQYDTLNILGDTLVNFLYDTITREHVQIKYINKVHKIIVHEVRSIENKAQIRYLVITKNRDSIEYLKSAAAYRKEIELKTAQIEKNNVNRFKYWLLIFVLTVYAFRKQLRALINL